MYTFNFIIYVFQGRWLSFHAQKALARSTQSSYAFGHPWDESSASISNHILGMLVLVICSL